MSETVQSSGTVEKKKYYYKDTNEWQEIEDLVMLYQKQFVDPTVKEQSDLAMMSLLNRFYPLFKKYLILLKSAQINFNDAEMKRFVLNFIGDPKLKQALRRNQQSATIRAPIYYRFNFIRETYGSLPEEEIMNDLQFAFMVMAQRYRQLGRNFTGYIYNAYCYEVARNIKKFIDNPANIHYRNIEYEEYMQRYSSEFTTESNPFESHLCENEIGIPDTTWIIGLGCSKIFERLTPLERKIIVKYYLEDCNDRQVAESFGMHINFVNARRRSATETLAGVLALDKSNIKRNRKGSSKKKVQC